MNDISVVDCELSIARRGVPTSFSGDVNLNDVTTYSAPVVRKIADSSLD